MFDIFKMIIVSVVSLFVGIGNFLQDFGNPILGCLLSIATIIFLLLQITLIRLKIKEKRKSIHHD